jgi:hypothetical protein
MAISKEVGDKLMKMEGGCAGAIFQTDVQYIQRVEGEGGLKAVETEIENIGYHIDYNNIKLMVMYPIGLRALSLLVAEEVFDWDDARIMDMGRCAPKHSFMTKLVSRFFSSMKNFAKTAPEYWRKQWNIGSLECVELDKNKRHAILHLSNFEVDPILCKYISGYLLGSFEILGAVKNAKVEEVKCIHKGDDCHELIIRWD